VTTAERRRAVQEDDVAAARPVDRRRRVVDRELLRGNARRKGSEGSCEREGRVDCDRTSNSRKVTP
jgi:hypothetical protein